MYWETGGNGLLFSCLFVFYCYINTFHIFFIVIGVICDTLWNSRLSDINDCFLSLGFSSSILIISTVVVTMRNIWMHLLSFSSSPSLWIFRSTVPVMKPYLFKRTGSCDLSNKDISQLFHFHLTPALKLSESVSLFLSGLRPNQHIQKCSSSVWLKRNVMVKACAGFFSSASFLQSVPLSSVLLPVSLSRKKNNIMRTSQSVDMFFCYSTTVDTSVSCCLLVFSSFLALPFCCHSLHSLHLFIPLISGAPQEALSCSVNVPVCVSLSVAVVLLCNVCLCDASAKPEIFQLTDLCTNTTQMYMFGEELHWHNAFVCLTLSQTPFLL